MRTDVFLDAVSYVWRCKFRFVQLLSRLSSLTRKGIFLMLRICSKNRFAPGLETVRSLELLIRQSAVSSVLNPTWRASTCLGDSSTCIPQFVQSRQSVSLSLSLSLGLSIGVASDDARSGYDYN